MWVMELHADLLFAFLSEWTIMTHAVTEKVIAINNLTLRSPIF